MLNNLKIGALFLATISFNVSADFYSDLAYNHAPIHYQDTDNTNARADYITAIDYDYDWFGDNNWDNFATGSLAATAYYSVVESCTHYFVTYSFFHPRDWVDTPFDGEHENDLEGVLFVIRKNGSTYGTLEGMITVFHSDFFSFAPNGSPFKSGRENIDGNVSFTSYDGAQHARTASEAKGHGIKAWPYIGSFNGADNQDGVIYYPSRGEGEVPANGNSRSVKYKLVNLFKDNGVWQQAMHESSLSTASASTFASWGTFKGNNSGGCGKGAPFASCGTNSANSPWGWNDGNDGESYRGEFALHPIRLTEHNFSGLGNYSRKYINNRFASDLQRAGYNSSHKPQGYSDKLDLGLLYNDLTNSCQ